MMSRKVIGQQKVNTMPKPKPPIKPKGGVKPPVVKKK